MNRDRCEGARCEGNDTDDDGDLSHGLCFYFESEFHPLPTRSWKKQSPRAQEGVLFNSLSAMDGRDRPLKN